MRILSESYSVPTTTVHLFYQVAYRWTLVKGNSNSRFELKQLQLNYVQFWLFIPTLRISNYCNMFGS